LPEKGSQTPHPQNGDIPIWRKSESDAEAGGMKFAYIN
jgi:hypothetical protein